MAGPAMRSIVTPEAVPLDVELAGVASRTLAALLDLLAIGAVWLLALIAMAASGVDLAGTGAAIAYAVFSLLLVVAWFCGFETLMHGRTPGKLAFGLQVVSTDGTPERFQQAFLRAAVGFVDFVLLPVGVVAVIAVLLSPRDQRLGDMAAGTLVTRARVAAGVVAPAWFVPPWGFERYAASLDVSALDSRSYGLVRAYLLRSHQLTPVARDHLAIRIANPVAIRMGHAPPRSMHPHAFLTCVAAAWQRVHAAY